MYDNILGYDYDERYFTKFLKSDQDISQGITGKAFICH